MAFTTFSGGVNTSFSSQLNANFLPTKIAELYTSNGFDVNDTSSGTHTNDHTLSLTSGELDNATYVLISISYHSQVDHGGATSVTNNLKVERAQSGGGFSTVQDLVVGQSKGGAAEYNATTLILPITLTAGEKSNGLDIKITATVSVSGGTAGTASMTNLGVMLHTSY